MLPIVAEGNHKCKMDGRKLSCYVIDEADTVAFCPQKCASDASPVTDAAAGVKDVELLKHNASYRVEV